MKKIAITLAALCTVFVLGSPAQAQTGSYCPNNGYNQQYSEEEQAEILRAYLTLMYLQQMQQNAQQGGQYYNQGYQGNTNRRYNNNQSNGSYFNHSNATGVSSGGDSSGFYISGPGFSYSNF